MAKAASAKQADAPDDQDATAQSSARVADESPKPDAAPGDAETVETDPAPAPGSGEAEGAPAEPVVRTTTRA